jgi:signal transduction histidine kinase
VEVPGDLVGLAVAAYAAALLETRLEDPRNAEFRSIYYALSFSVGALAAGLAWSVVRARATRAAVSRLAADLGEAPRPGTLQSTLSSAVGDPTLEVAYWLPASGRYVDGGGQSVWAPFAGSGRAVTPIVRDGRPVALVAHAADLLESTALPEEIGSTARLAVDNERLQAEVLAQLGDLRASRARIVEKADAERRRLERNLHDGAQQRLLALSYDLRLARAGAQADGAAGIAAALGSAAGEAQTALLELRDLAHGIYPAVLAEGGLGPALATVADTSSIAVELGEVATERLPVPVETTAYVTVLETIVDAEARGATFVGVDVRRDADRLVVALDDDGAPRSRRPIHVADRVGALGGRIELGPSSLQAELPCE